MKVFFALIITFIIISPSSYLSKIHHKIDASYLSPSWIYCDQTSGKAYVSLSTAGKIAVVDTRNEKFERHIPLPFNPGGLALSVDSKTLYVTDQEPEGSLHLISLSRTKTIKKIALGHTPGALKITPDGKLIFVANRFSNSVSVIDAGTNKVLKHIPVEREPTAIAISPDGKIVAVTNNIPYSAATDDNISAKVTLIDRNSLKVIHHIKMAPGSHSFRDIIFSKDGKYLYLSHILSRNQFPTTQLEHGWMNTNALSILEVSAGKYYTTVLLDNFDRGAANPAGMGVSEDGKQLYVALSGVHELCGIDMEKMHLKLDAAKRGSFIDMAVNSFSEIPNDLRFLYGISKRIAITGMSPRHLAVSGEKVLVSAYFSSGLEIFTNLTGKVKGNVVLLGNEPEMNDVRRGELYFCDASLCFQHWQSCISCHPDARSDGLNWDLLNDGMGNPKNTKSMLHAHRTAPAMITGVRENAEAAVRGGIKHILFATRPESEAQDIDSYLKSLNPIASPYLVKGKLSNKAVLGKLVFEKAGCDQCHSGALYTDSQKYNVGTGSGRHQGDAFDTPTLSEVWRTAPYLYDGRAKTLKEVLTTFNPEDNHGQTSGLSAEEMSNLVEYVLSL